MDNNFFPKFPTFENNISSYKDYFERNFLKAVKNRNVNAVARYIFIGVDPNCRDKHNGFTALHIAVENNDVAMVLKLLSYKKIDVQPISLHRYVPLLVACDLHEPTIVNALLQYGANPNVRDRLQRTPLHAAVQYNFTILAKILFQHGAHVNAFDMKEMTPLHIAILHTRCLPMAKLLIEHGANINLHLGNMSLFLEAVLACHTMEEVTTIMFLVDNGADIHQTDKITNMNALHFVALSGYSLLASKLVKLGIDVNHKDKLGRTPYNIAHTHGNYGVIFIIEQYYF